MGPVLSHPPASLDTPRWFCSTVQKWSPPSAPWLDWPPRARHPLSSPREISDTFTQRLPSTFMATTDLAESVWSQNLRIKGSWTEISTRPPRHNSNWISLRDSSLGMVWGWEVQLWLVRSERSKSLAHSKAVQWWSLATTVASDNLLCCGAFNGYNRCVSRFFAPGHFGIESWEIHNTKHICARTTVDKKLYMVCIYIYDILYIYIWHIYIYDT